MLMNVRRGAAYCRFSSSNQRVESIDAQLRAINEYAKKQGILIVETYIDEAKSATTDKRPAFQQMIADSSKKLFEIVICHKLDRFARNRFDSAYYKRELKKNGVALHSVLEDFTNGGPEGIILESVLEGMAEYYSKNLAVETRKGLLENARTCSHTGGQAPLGFSIDETTRKLIINPEEAETVKLIFDMYANGSGYGEILHKLHEEGRRTKKGQDFGKNSLNSILTNEKYVGTYIYNKSSAKGADGRRNSHRQKPREEQIIIEGGCPQIIDPEVFAKVQQRMEQNRRRAGKYNAKTNYKLSGLVYCKECGKAMVGNRRQGGRDKKDYITYRCPTPKHNCKNKEISRDYLEAAVIATLEREIFNPKSLERIIQRIKAREAIPSNRREQLQEQLKEASAGLKNIVEAVEAGLLSEALITRHKQLEAEKAELEAALEKQIASSAMYVDPQRILQQYGQVKQQPESQAYKDVLKEYVTKILVGRFSVELHLRTGLGVCDELDTVLSLRRQVIYLEKGAL